MNALDECHARGFLWKASGMCNQAKRNLTLCLRHERIQRTKHNQAVAMEKRKKMEEKWKKIDAES